MRLRQRSIISSWRAGETSRRARALADAEVEQLHEHAFTGDTHQKHVPGLQVAVHDAGVVRCGEPGGGLHGDADRVCQWQTLLALEPRFEALSGQQLHHEVGLTLVGGVEIHHLYDARVIQRAREPRLAHEARGHLGVLAVQRPELLQRGVAIEVELAGEVDARHAAAAELPHDLVAADAHQPIFGAPPITVN